MVYYWNLEPHTKLYLTENPVLETSNRKELLCFPFPNFGAWPVCREGDGVSWKQ